MDLLYRPLLLSVLSVTLVGNAYAQEIDGGAAAAEEPRLLGIGINEGSIGFEKAFAAARSAGVQFVEIPNAWDDIEKKPGEFSNQWLDIADTYYPTVNVSLVISLNPIDTNKLRMPADLRDKRLDDPQVIQRYNAAADYILSRAKKARVIAFAIGNEIDATLGSDLKKWQEYERFFRATSAHVRSAHPELPIGTKIQLRALVGTTSPMARTVNEHADVVLTTYYPLDETFHIKSSDLIGHDFNALFNQYPNIPIYMLEAGCPSSELLGSSEERQSEFVAQVFKVWDAHTQLKAVNFIWLHDISKADVESFTKYYGVGERGFAEYLGSLGLRRHDGTDKKAFMTLKREAAKRSFASSDAK